jgi:hypothetical protein
MALRADKGLGIDWNLGLHKGQIDDRGEILIHEIGLRCTCNQEDMFAGETEHGVQAMRKRKRFGCPICGGYGYIYRNPRPLIGMVTGIRQNKAQLEPGWAVPGDAILSVKPDYMISAGDLITFTWPEPVADGQVLIRGAAAVNDNQTRKTGLEDNEDRLWYNAINSIYCEDEDGHVYSSGSDFELTGNKILKWVGGSPIKGKSYTIKYNAYMEWVVFMPPDIRRDRDRDLGTRVAIRKRHVALINTSAAISPLDKTPFCERLKGCQ